MQKLSELTDKEKSNDQALDGSYRVVLNLELRGDTTFDALVKKLAKVADIDSISIEKYTVDYELSIGDVVELTDSIVIEKPVYLDTAGNLVISDYPVSSAVETLGHFKIELEKGTIAEINRSGSDSAEVLFSGYSLEVRELNKVAHLGILNLPCKILIKLDA